VRHWRNAAPAAAALVTSAGKLLLVRRAHDPWRGLWCAPSGFCDGLEHPIATAERETREESGIAVRVTGYLGTWISYYAENDAAGTDSDELVSVAYYHAERVGADGATPDPAEVTEARWFAWGELPERLAPPSAFPIILAAWRVALRAGTTTSPLPDRAR